MFDRAGGGPLLIPLRRDAAASSSIGMNCDSSVRTKHSRGTRWVSGRPFLFHSVPCADSIVAVLERSNRVCQIDLRQVPSSDMGEVLAAMQVSYPKLTRLLLLPFETVPVLPDLFLRRSGPTEQ